MHNKIVNKNKPIKKNYSKILLYYAFSGLVIWTAFICLALYWHSKTAHNRLLDAARIEARMELAFKKNKQLDDISGLHQISPENILDSLEINVLKQFEEGIIENQTSFTIMYGLLWMVGLFGTFLFTFLLNYQVKKRLEAEKELRDKDKLEGVIEMARAVCHELNQPLQMIVGNTEILMMKDIDKETVNKRVKLIKEQVDRMGEMTGNLIKIASYKTMHMPQGKVIDIEKSSGKSTKS